MFETELNYIKDDTVYEIDLEYNKEITKTIAERITKEQKLKDTKEKINLNF